MDADHLDIYGTAESVEQAFIDFSSKIKPGGMLIRHHSLKRGRELKGDRQVTYALSNREADVYVDNIEIYDGSYEFDVIMKENRLNRVRLNMGGLHNVENVLAAITAASSLGIENEKIKESVNSFRGVKRRFEYIVKNDSVVFVDDYAHHPEELRALITSARNLFPTRKCTIIFQPHLFSRTKDFADGFAEVLDLADEVILLPIYPARELPIPGVTSEMLLSKMKNPDHQLLTKDELLNWIQENYEKDENALLITAGAGDIDTLLGKIKSILT
jgi:UDP-N-acetylmuramate--alanine ligase